MFAFSRAAKRRRLTFYPVRTIALSFAATILIGSLLLMLPISSREGTVTPFLDCLFTATSATCVTGLVVYDTYLHWTGFGQVVIIALIQVGGLGLSTLAAFFNLLIGRKMGLRGMHLAQESVAALGDDIRQNEFSGVYAFEIEQLVKGEAEEIHLLQMKDGNRLHAGKTYLPLLFKRPVDDPSEYEVAGSGNQCAFWIENSRVQGYDAAIVQQLREAEPEIDTIEKLAAYFG